MKTLTTTFFASLILLQSCATVADTKLTSIDAVDIIEATQKVLVDAADRLEKRNLKLSKVTLSLATVSSKENKDGLKILFFGVDAKKSNSITNRVTVLLEPPKDSTKAFDVSSNLTTENTRLLLNSIIAFSDSLRSLKSTDMPLEVTSLSGEIAFVVKKSSSGELGFELAPVDIGFGHENSSSSEQKLTFVLTRE